MAKITYIGDEPTITEAGFTFERGKAVTVPDDHPRLAKLQGNPTFSSEKVKAADLPPAEEAEPGPLDQSVADLEAHLESVDDADEIDRLIADETAGKSRSGALRVLEARKAALAG